MKRLIALLALLLMPAQSFGSILASKLTFDGTTDTLDDESVGMAVDFNNDDILNTGDVIFGIVRIDARTPGATAFNPPRVHALYAFQVTADADVNGIITFGAVVNNADNVSGNGTPSIFDGLKRNDFTLQKMITNVNNLGITSPVVSDANWAKAGFAILTNAADSDPLAVDLAGVLNGYTIATTHMKAATGWNLELVAGFDAADDYYKVKVTDSSIANLNQLRSQGSAGQFGLFAGGFTVLDHTMGSGIVFLPVQGENPGGSSQTGTYHDMVIESGTLNGVRTDASAEKREWMYRDNADFRVNAVPEPTSLLAWAGLIVAGRFGLRRRK